MQTTKDKYGNIIGSLEWYNFHIEYIKKSFPYPYIQTDCVMEYKLKCMEAERKLKYNV
jgi:hypothetical protein